MAEHQVRRLPVVDDDNKPIGVVSLTDLAIECDRSDTGMEQLATTLAAVCRPRTPKHRTA
jgi:CBS-domain-containing membrane protein